jgi:hypothetical protein
MSSTSLHSLTLPRHTGKLETYLVRPESLRFRNASGKVVPAILHAIERQDIDAGSILPVVNFFPVDIPRHELRESSGRFIFAPMGYADDQEELYLTASVREYFQAITDLWPHWLFSSCFFFPSAVVIALCCVDNLTVCRSEDRVEVTYDLDAMEDFFNRCLETTATLDAWAGISRHESVRRLEHFRRTLGLPC